MHGDMQSPKAARAVSVKGDMHRPCAHAAFDVCIIMSAYNHRLFYGYLSSAPTCINLAACGMEEFSVNEFSRLCAAQVATE